MAEAGYEAAFRAAILDPGVPTPAGLASAHGGIPPARFDVYRNNVTVSLVKALSEIFPAVARIVGERRFADLARLFVRAHPPKSPLVFCYGHEFPAFIESFAPAAAMPYLADVARLERAWLDAYHAAVATPLSPQDLALIPPDELPDARFVRHPAASLVQSRFAAVTIFRANRDEPSDDRIDATQPENGLLARPGAEIRLRSISSAEAAFLAALFDGRTLAEGAAAGGETLDLSAAIGLALNTGIFTALDRTDQAH